MRHSVELTIAIPSVKPLLRARAWRDHGLVFAVFSLACFALLPMARGVTPAPDGFYDNQTTAEGKDALNSLNTTSANSLGNTAVGYQALFNTSTGGGNTGIGVSVLFTNTTGNFNTASGGFSLFSNQTGSYNVANGYAALYGNTTGIQNTAHGYAALGGNTTGQNNTGNGYSALGSNTTGDNNTAIGYLALQGNSMTGFDNTAAGANALKSNTEGSQNTANGVSALQQNTTGYNNTADGSFALLLNTTGFYNVASGTLALSSNTTGNNNAALGPNALLNNTTGSSNIGLGANGGKNLTTGSNNIDIGNNGVAGDTGRIRIGTAGTHKAVFVAGIYGAAAAGGVGIVVGSNGHLGTTTSSKRFKQEIKPMDKASEAILALEPVTFRYKHDLDPEGIPQFGLVAEEVEKVNPALVARDDEGKAYTVRYEAVNAMLLNEFLKEHRKVEQQERRLQTQEAKIAQQQKQIEALTAGLEKVSHQFRSATVPELVVNNE